MKRIGVFCSGCEQISSRYFDAARGFGEWMGSQGMTLVYGGSDMGLMECIARAVKENGGVVVGVVPTKLEEKGRVSQLLDVTFHTENLSERKDVILRESDVLVALPGGVGTLDEVFHVIASCSIGYHSKRVVFYNVDGFWDGLLNILEQMRLGGFIRKPFSKYYSVACTENELKALLLAE